MKIEEIIKRVAKAQRELSRYSENDNELEAFLIIEGILNDYKLSQQKPTTKGMTAEEVFKKVMGHEPNKEFGVHGSFHWDDIIRLMQEYAASQVKQEQKWISDEEIEKEAERRYPNWRTGIGAGGEFTDEIGFEIFEESAKWMRSQILPSPPNKQ